MLLCLFVCFFFLLLYYALWFTVETCTWCLRWQELKWTGLQHVVLCLYGNVQHLLWLWIPETSTNFLQLPFIHTVDLGVSSFLENLCFTSLSSLTHHLTLGLYWRLVKWVEEKGSIILGLDLSLLMGRCLWAVNFVFLHFTSVLPFPSAFNREWRKLEVSGSESMPSLQLG